MYAPNAPGGAVAKTRLSILLEPFFVPSASEEVQWDGSRPAFVQLPEWLLFHPDLSDSAKLTWLALASYADKQGTAFPGVKTLGKKRGRGTTVLFEHIKQLEAVGALRRTARFRDSDGGRTSTLYVLAWSHPLVQVPETVPESLLAADEAPGETTAGPPSGNPDRGTPENRIGARPENRVAPRPETRTPRTRPSYEQTPVVPTNDNDTGEANQPSQPTPNPKGASLPSDTPEPSFNQHHVQGRRPTPRELGTNPRAVAAKARAARDEQKRLDQARQYGTRMASVDPLPWTLEEFVGVAREASNNDEHWAEAAVKAYAESVTTSQTKGSG